MAVFRAEKLALEIYFGRFGRRIERAEELNDLAARWFITCDNGLVVLGAAREDPRGNYRVKSPRQKLSFQTLPQELGAVVLSSEWIKSQGQGQIYLIELNRPVRVSGQPIELLRLSGKRSEVWK